MKTGLVLEGGAMRGVYTSGVLDFFLDQNIHFDVCLGVSAGACLACSYLSLQRGRGYAVMTDYLNNKEYCSLSSLLRTGDLFGAEFLYHKIPEELYPIDNSAFLKNSTKFYSVVTDCNTGAPAYLRVEDMFRDVDFVRASSSLPLLARMVEINGTFYLDGGVSDPIPVKQALFMGCDRIVVVLTRHRRYRKSKERSLPLIRCKYRKYPNLINAMENRHKIYNESLSLLDHLEEEGRALVLAPEEFLKIRRTEKNLDILQLGYEQGYQSAMTNGTHILNFLNPCEGHK